MHRYWLFVVFQMLPLLALAQAPGYTEGGGKFLSSERLVFPAIDQAKVAAQDGESERKGGRYRYAIPFQADGAARISGKSSHGGRWITLKSGQMLWQLEVEAAGAKTLDFIFAPFRLPHGAELWVYDSERKLARGPYTDRDNNAEKVLATATVPGARAVIELRVAPEARPFVELELRTVHSGYRGFGWDGHTLQPKSGSCNVDSICPEGNPYRQQIQAVGRYTVGGGLCTGTLMNNTNQNTAPLFLSARHCYASQADANTVVVYWNYASPTCRTVGSSQNGQVLPDSISTHTQSGATLLASSTLTDFTLAQLNQSVPLGANPFFAGWDRRNVVPVRAYCIHHPSGDEKRISLDNDPLRIITATQSFGSGADQFSLASGNGLQIIGADFQLGADGWDVGTTEQGSSGSALFSPENRVVGTLSGGAAACGNRDSDYYGRMAIAFATGSTAQARLREHLDPGNTGVETIEGRSACSAPQLTLTPNPVAATAGSDITYSLAISGGVAPYSVRWDVDGDGTFDRTQTVAGTGTTLSVRYGRAVNINVAVSVTDAGGCIGGATRAMDVTAHDVRLGTFQALTQICGDNDNAVEPGERWTLPVSLTNSGGASTQGAFAIFSKSAATQSVAGASDTSAATGYSYRDNRIAGCGYNFVDLQTLSTISNLPLTASSPGFPATDDGRTATFNLNATNSAFPFLGQTVSEIVVSTNGYISTDSAATGGDTEAVCTSQPRADLGRRRLNIFHSDLVLSPTNGNIRVAQFTSCPRAPDVGAAQQSCLIVQWSNAGVFSGSTTTPAGNFDLQAVIYQATGQIAYQYRNSFPASSPRNVVGIVNPGASVFNYQCQDSTAVPQTFKLTGNRAVCLFPANQQPAPLGGNASELRLATPSINLGNMSSGQTVTANLEFQVAPNAACGGQYQVSYLGAADERAFSGPTSSQPVGTTITVPAACNVTSNCPATGVTQSFRQGAFFNTRRGGNGLVQYSIPSGANTTYFGTLFTGERNRLPTWYYLQGPLADAQFSGALFRRTRNVAASGFVLNAPDTAMGSAQITVIDKDRVVFTHQFNGEPRAGELLTHLFKDFAASNPNRTGAWYWVNEYGWGQTWESFVQNGVNTEFNVNYVYDATGFPRWTLAQDTAAAGSLPALGFEVHCPSCGWIDIGPTRTDRGTVTRQFLSPRNANVSTSFSVPGSAGSRWDRSTMPFIILTPELP